MSIALAEDVREQQHEHDRRDQDEYEDLRHALDFDDIALSYDDGVVECES